MWACARAHCSRCAYLSYPYAHAVHSSLPAQRAQRHIRLRQQKTQAELTGTLCAALSPSCIPVQQCFLSKGTLPSMTENQNEEINREVDSFSAPAGVDVKP